MFGFGKDTEFPKLFVQVSHKGSHAWLDNTEIMVFHFLPLRRLCPEQGAAGIDKVFAFFEHSFVHQKIFLFRTDCRNHAFCTFVSKQPQNSKRLFVDGIHRTQQRSFFVKRFAAIGTESRWNAEGISFNKSVAGWVPCRVAACLKSSPQPSGRETGSVRFAFNQFIPRKFH